ncbi:hypothetical protein BGZ94_007765 [Podila epigama]|nr:hypothetical protein BGZ94_007765 [Podila epigama]
MHSTHPPFVDLDPPASWAKPASALGLANPLSHLSQSQQVRKLQEQIQHHRQLHQSRQGGPGKGKRITRVASAGTDTTSTNKACVEDGGDNSDHGIPSTPEQHIPSNNRQSQHLENTRHINISTQDDDDSNMSSNDFDREGGDNSNDVASYYGGSGGMDVKPSTQHAGAFQQHHYNTTATQLTHGISLQNLADLNSTSPSSFSPPKPIASEQNSSYTTSMLTLGLSAGYSGDQSNTTQTDNGHTNINLRIKGSGPSLESLSTLTAMSSSFLSMSERGKYGSPSHRHSSGPHSLLNSTTSFHPQSLPSIYQNHVSGPIGNINTNSSVMFSSITTQAVPRETHQQRSSYQHQMTCLPSLSTSLPASLNIQQFHEEQHGQTSNPNTCNLNSTSDYNDENSTRRGSQSKGLLVIPPHPRSIPPRPPKVSAPRKYHGRQTRKVPVANIIKEVVTPTRRMAHILSEQKRREKINGGFDDLKSVIPE